jgi:hypothetical protein
MKGESAVVRSWRGETLPVGLLSAGGGSRIECLDAIAPPGPAETL